MRDTSGQEQAVARLRRAGYEVACDLRPFGRWRATACATGRPSGIAYGRTTAEALALLCETLEGAGELPRLAPHQGVALVPSVRRHRPLEAGGVPISPWPGLAGPRGSRPPGVVQ